MKLTSFSISVAPEILSSSRCVKILAQFRCTCDSQGNPLPSLVWELAGETVNHSADIPVREVPLGNMQMRSLITLYHWQENMPSLVCLSINPLGSDRLLFNVSSSETQLGTGICITLRFHWLWFSTASLFLIVMVCGDISRSPYCLSADRLGSGSTGDAAGVHPSAAHLQVRNFTIVKEHVVL